MRNETSPAPDITGTWEMRSAQNGMMPLQTYAAGSGGRLIFSNTDYEKQMDGTVSKGRYEMVKDSTVSASVGLELPAGTFAHRLIFDGDTAADKTFVEVRGDTLELLQGFFPVDAGSRRVYVRVEGR